MKIVISKVSLVIVFFLFKSVQLIAQETPVKNIILLIGDGMGLEQVYAGITVSKDKLNIERAQYIGFSKTYSADNYTTDSGAGGTAIATGTKTKNKYIGVDTNGAALKSILSYAEDNGKSTGIVTTCDVTHATPASFYAHNISRYNEEQIALDILSEDIDVLIGGGMHLFDSLGIVDSLRTRGYLITNDLKDIKPQKSSQAIGLVAPEHPQSILEGRDPKYLESAVDKSIKMLSSNENGFFLMVEGSQIDWAGHNNDIKYLVAEMLDFDKAIGKAFEFADQNPGTLVIVTADHETGGLSLPGGNLKTGNIQGKFNTTGHTGVMVPIYSYGTGAASFSHIMENTDIFHKMMEAYQFKADK